MRGASWALTAGPLVERSRDDAGRHPAGADPDLDLGADRGARGGQVAKPDTLLQERRERARGDRAGGLSVEKDRIAVAGDAPANDLEADQFPRGTAGLLRRQHGPPVEVPFRIVERDDPAEARLDKRGGLVHVVAVEHHLGFEPQRVPRPEPGGQQSVAPAGFDQPLPERRGRLRRHENLKTVFSGVAGPGDDGWLPVHRSLDEAVEADRWQIER